MFFFIYYIAEKEREKYQEQISLLHNALNLLIQDPNATGLFNYFNSLNFEIILYVNGC